MKLMSLHAVRIACFGAAGGREIEGWDRIDAYVDRKRYGQFPMSFRFGL